VPNLSTTVVRIPKRVLRAMVRAALRAGVVMLILC
jgi:hypothetical protein